MTTLQTCPSLIACVRGLMWIWTNCGRESPNTCSWRS